MPLQTNDLIYGIPAWRELSGENKVGFLRSFLRTQDKHRLYQEGPIGICHEIADIELRILNMEHLWNVTPLYHQFLTADLFDYALSGLTQLAQDTQHQIITQRYARLCPEMRHIIQYLRTNRGLAPDHSSEFERIITTRDQSVPANETVETYVREQRRHITRVLQDLTIEDHDLPTIVNTQLTLSMIAFLAREEYLSPKRSRQLAHSLRSGAYSELANTAEYTPTLTYLERHARKTHA